MLPGGGGQADMLVAPAPQQLAAAARWVAECEGEGNGNSCCDDDNNDWGFIAAVRRRPG